MIDLLKIVEGSSVDAVGVIRDSIVTMTQYIKETAINSRPEPYIIQNLYLATWNLLVAVFAAIFGLLGAIFGYLGYKYSKKTAKNVARISVDTQIVLYFDFAKELYGNIVTIVNLLEISKKGSKMPLNKIGILRISDFDDIFHIDDYNQDKDIYLKMKHIKDRMRSYNFTVESISRFLGRNQCLCDDLSDLLFRSVQILIFTKQAISILNPNISNREFILFLFYKLHVRHMINNSEYIGKQWKTSSFKSKIADLEDCYLENINAKVRFDSIIDDVEYLNPAVNDREYMEIVAGCSDDEYKQLVNKTHLDKKDMEVLLSKIISYDSFIHSREM